MKHDVAAIAGLLMLAGCALPGINARPAGTAQSDTPPADRAYQEGKAHLASGHPGLAIVAFETALANNPGSVSVLNALGAAYDDLHRYDLAQNYYRQALMLAPQNPDVINNMAVSLRLAGSPDSVQWFAKAARLDPKNSVIESNVSLAAADASTARYRNVTATHDNIAVAAVDQPRIERASALEYDVDLPPTPTTWLGKAVKPPAARNVVEVRPAINVPPLRDATGALPVPTQPAVPAFDPSLIACAPNVAPNTLGAIIRTESGGNPLALHVNGADEQPPPARDPEEAARMAENYVARGYNVDVGLMQVNSRNLAASGHTLKQALDPCTNVLHGSKILTTDYAKAARTGHDDPRALLAAISAYNTGDFHSGFANGYVAQVVTGSGPVAPREVPVAPREVKVAPREVSVAPREVPVAPREVPVAPHEVQVAPREVSVAPRAPMRVADHARPHVPVVERGNSADLNEAMREMRQRIDRLEHISNLPNANELLAAEAVAAPARSASSPALAGR